MSKQVDERVVSMEFDNQRFEKNVSTTMSTLDKLKERLHFKGASKGLDNLHEATKKTDMNMEGLGRSVDTVRTRFSAMDVIGVTALANITNSAVNAGKRLVSAFTIDPVKTGFSEYETQINAVQTILANTESKGTTLNDVNQALDTLNKYADKTIYNFTEMTKNIGTFTAAGVDLDTSVSAIQGIANLAAVSGSTSQQASTAMYQLSQALSSGTVKLMDWNSVVNAGMGGEVFQNALKDTARIHGVAIDQMIKDEGSFRETLSQGWLTSEILTETLKKFTMAAEEGSEEWNNYKKSLMDQGYTEEQANNILKMANTATDAATKVKTFSQLMDTLKEAMQSGWTQTWEIIIGDFEEAKALLTRISDFLGGLINKFSDWRNNLLEGALGSPFEGLLEKLDSTGLGKFDELADGVKGATGGLEYFQKVVDNVWRGDYKNAPFRYELLDAAGYDHRVVQDLVNKGAQYKLTLDDIEASHKKFGLSFDPAADGAGKMMKAIEDLSDEELKNLGYTEDEIKMLRQFSEEAKKAGVPLDEFIKNLDGMDGRTMLIESLANIGRMLGDVFKSVGEAWRSIFDPITSSQLYNAIKGFYDFTTKLQVTDEVADKLRRTFKGLFAILDIVTTIFGGAFKIAFKVVSILLDGFGLSILDVTAMIGDAAVGVRDWMDKLLNFTHVFEFLIPVIKTVASFIGGLLTGITKIGPAFSGAVSGIKKWFASLKESDNIPRDIVLGIVKGLGAGVKMIGSAITIIGKTIIEKIKDILGIHSPSTVMIAIGGFIIAGLVTGLTGSAPAVWDAVKSICGKLVDIVKDLDLGAIFSGATIGGLLFVSNKFANAFDALTSPLEGVGDVLSGTGDVLTKFSKKLPKLINSASYVVKNFGKVLKSTSKVLSGFAFDLKAKALLKIAGAIGILVGAVVLLTFIDPAKLWNAVGVIGALAAILAVLSISLNKLGSGSIINTAKITLSLMGLSMSLLIMAGVINIVSGMDPGALIKGGAVVIALGGMMVGLMAATKLYDKDSNKVGSVLMKMSFAMLLMVGVIALVSTMSTGSLIKGTLAVAAIGGIMVGLIAATKLFNKDANKVASSLMKFSFAMLLMVGVIALVSTMSTGSLIKGTLAVTAIGGIMVGLIAATKLFNKDADKVGSTLFKMSAAMLLLVGVIALVSTMSPGNLVKGIVVVTVLGGIMVGLMAAVNKFGSDGKKVASTLLTLSLSIGILALVSTLLGFLSIEHLAKGVTAIGILGAIMSLMIAATKNAKDCKANLIVMTVAIGVMAAAVAGLSFIDPSRLAVATGALALLMGMFALIEKSAGHVKTSVGVLIVMTLTVGLLAGIIALLSNVSPDRAIGASVSLSLLLATVGGIFILLDKFVSSASGAAKGALALSTMFVPLLAFVSIMYMLPKSDVSLANLGILLGLVAGSAALMPYLDLVAKKYSSAYKGALALSTMFVPLMAFVLVLHALPDTNVSLINLAALTVLVGGATLLMKPLASISKYSKNAAKGAASLTIMALPLIAFAAALNLMKDVDNAIESAGALSLMLVAISGVMVILGALKGVVSGAVSALPYVAIFIAGLAAIVLALGAIAQIPGVNWLISEGGNFLEALGTAIGQFVGGIVGGVAKGFTSALPEIGTDLSAFMNNAKDFIEGAKQVDMSVLEGVGILTGCILALTAANLIEGIASFITGKSSISSFAEELPKLGEGLNAFSQSVEGLNTESVTAAANAAKALAKMADTIPNSGGIAAWFAGENSITQFADELPKLGRGLKDFSTEVDGVNPESITAAANAAKALAEMAAVIPNSGGVAAWFAGENSITQFADELPKLGEGLTGFSESISGIENMDNVTAATNAAKSLAEMTKHIPNSGGVAAWFAGENSITQFANELPKLGDGLTGFSESISGIENMDNVTAAANAAKTLAEMTKYIPNSGGVAAWFAGENSVTQFANELPILGDGLTQFAESVSGIENMDNVEAAANAAKSLAEVSKHAPKEGGLAGWFTGESSISNFVEYLPDLGTGLGGFADSIKDIENIDDVTAAANAAKALAEVSQHAPKEGGFAQWFTGESSISTWCDELPSLGKALSGFAESIYGIANIEDVTAASNAAKALAEISKTAPKNNDNLESLGDGIVEFGKDLSSYFAYMGGVSSESISTSTSAIDAVKNIQTLNSEKITSVSGSIASLIGVMIGMGKISGDTVSGFTKALSELGKANVDGFIQAFEDAKTSMETAAGTLVDSFTDTVNGKKSTFTSTGEGLIGSFVTGMKNKSADVTTAATAVGNSAALGATTSYANFVAAGKYVVEGFAEGISANSFKASAKAVAMAKAALQAAEDELGVQSPSKEFESVGKYVVEGFAIGVKKNARRAEDATAEMGRAANQAIRDELGIHSPATKAIEIAKHYIDGFVTGMSTNTDAEKSAEEKARKITESFQNGLEQLDLNDQTLDLSAQLNAEAFDEATVYSKKYERQLQRIALAEEEYQEMKAAFGENSKHTQESYNKLLQEQIDLETMATQRLQSRMDKINAKKGNGEISYIDQLAAYQRLRTEYAEGSEERKLIDSEIYNIQKSIATVTEDYYKEVERVNKEHNDKRIAREQEYLEACQEVNDKLSDDIQAISDEYDEALASRTKDIADTWGLFDEVSASEEVNKNSLTKNLNDQLNALTDWKDSLNDLQSRGIDDGLLSELQAMGPEAAAQIQALNKMSNVELGDFVWMWKQKTALAKQYATDELAEMKTEGEKEMFGLKKSAHEALKALEEEYNSDLETMNTDTDTELKELKETWMTNLGYIKQDVTSEFTNMVTESINIIGEQSQWSDAGSDIIDGVIQGINVNSSSLFENISAVMIQALNVAKASLGIHSPSKKFAEIGKYADLGFVEGLKGFSREVGSSAAEVGDTAIKSFKGSVARLTDVINSDIESQPTIRPVLDLSDVKSGAMTIGDMINSNPSVGVFAKLNSISTRMNRRNQNGENGEVVSTLEKLRKDLGKLDRASYNINGLSINEGSDVADAIETIIRAARIERRV